MYKGKSGVGDWCEHGRTEKTRKAIRDPFNTFHGKLKTGFSK